MSRSFREELNYPDFIIHYVANITSYLFFLDRLDRLFCKQIIKIYSFGKTGIYLLSSTQQLLNARSLLM